MPPTLMDIIAAETHGICYKTAQCMPYVSPSAPEPDASQAESITVWEHSAETSRTSSYIDLEPLSRNLSRSGEQILTYFLDGSRRVYKPHEIAYSYSGGRRVIYPVIAGQISVGCCRRVNRQLFPEKLTHEIVISLPDSADYDNNASRGFWQGLAHKLSAHTKAHGLEISAVLHYDSGRSPRHTSFDDKATAAIQTRMLNTEQALTESLTHRKLLNHKNYLIKDGSLEYRHKSGTPSQNYRWVIGLSKSFNPEACMNTNGKPDPGYIADLPVNHRTQAACFSNPEFLGDTKFAVWYIRLHDRKHTLSAFDGVVKAEKMLVTQEETASGRMNSDEIDTLSAYIMNERYPVCYGNDSRWASHIYPVYLTEQYIKSKYLSTEYFLHLF